MHPSQLEPFDNDPLYVSIDCRPIHIDEVCIEVNSLGYSVVCVYPNLASTSWLKILCRKDGIMVAQGKMQEKFANIPVEERDDTVSM